MSGRSRGVRVALLVLGLSLPLALTFGADRIPKSAGRSSTRTQGTTSPRVAAAADEDEREHPLKPLRAARGAVPKEEPPPTVDDPEPVPTGFQPEQLVTPGGLGGTVNLALLMTVLSVVPSVMIMTTCFVRFAVVLGLLRQALGTPQLPPNQVLMGLAFFLTVAVMTPVWQRSYNEGILPYSNPAPGETQPSLPETWDRSVRPIRQFMSDQIERAGNIDTLWMLIDYQQESAAASGGSYAEPTDYDEVPLATLVSAYLLSELKAAFVIGFQIFLPFLVIDMVVSTVLMSMGMMMLPPPLVSFPFKLLLFVLIDGWSLTVGMLLSSVQPLS
ncbi:MAG: flagellar type III secretion system pore protein FliP [Planctomycetales bacterium]